VARLSRGLTRLSPSLPRRKTAWDVGPGGGGIITLTGTVATILGTGSQLTTDGITLVRTRGHMNMWLDLVAAKTDGFVGAFGIGVVTSQAFAIGVTAMPTPFTDMDWDGWLFHQFVSIRGLDPATDLNPDGPRFQRFEVDSKAMRKLKEDDTIFAMIDVVESGTATARLDFNSRVLFKLP